MPRYDFDLLVVGAGSGGIRAARLAGAAGKRVAVAEQSALGGTCVNLGCVPKKLMVYASHVAEEMQDAAGYGWQLGAAKFDWPTLIANKNRAIGRLNGIYADMLQQANVRLLNGHASILDAHRVHVDGHPYRAERILIATGAQPRLPEICGRELILTSNHMFTLARQPQKIIIVGGGYIAVEFAGILHGLGSEVTLIYRGPQLLRGFDDDLRAHLSAEMLKKGIQLKFNTTIESVSQTEQQLQANLSDGTSLDTDHVLCAIGRIPNTQDLGLEQIGVELDQAGAIKVDERFQTNIPSLYAIGDVIDHIALTPVAIHQATVLINQLYHNSAELMDYANVPSAVFSQPSLATVGLSESLARAQYEQISIYRSMFRPLKGTLSGNREKTLMKLVVDASSDRVLGVHMVGPEAAEVIQGFAVALKAGAKKSVFDQTIGIHPSSAEEFVTMRQPLG